MHTWVWGQVHPESMDALMPLASLPVEIGGRNRLWRSIVSDAIRSDPEWKEGAYDRQPPSLRIAMEMLYFMSSSSRLRYAEAPNGGDAERLMREYVEKAVRTMDANDVLYAIESSRDYDPTPGLGRIEAPLIAVNFADDLINPPELELLEREIKRVPHGRAILIPQSDATRGHGSHTIAALWTAHLTELLNSPER